MRIQRSLPSHSVGMQLFSLQGLQEETYSVSFRPASGSLHDSYLAVAVQGSKALSGTMVLIPSLALPN